MRGELNAPCLINRNMAHHYWVHRGELKPICRLIHTNALGAPYGHCQPTGHGHGAKGGRGGVMAQSPKYREALTQSRVSKMEMKTIVSDVPVTVNASLASAI